MNHLIFKLHSTSPILAIFSLMVCLSLVDFPLIGSIFIGTVEARVGRPATPGSVAGVARRSTRRTVRRHHVVAGTRVRVLPAGCTTVFRRGINYHHCGGYYYRPYYEGNNVVYVVENP